MVALNLSDSQISAQSAGRSVPLSEPGALTEATACCIRSSCMPPKKSVQEHKVLAGLDRRELSCSRAACRVEAQSDSLEGSIRGAGGSQVRVSRLQASQARDRSLDGRVDTRSRGVDLLGADAEVVPTRAAVLGGNEPAIVGEVGD